MDHKPGPPPVGRLITDRREENAAERRLYWAKLRRGACFCQTVLRLGADGSHAPSECHAPSLHTSTQTWLPRSSSLHCMTPAHLAGTPTERHAATSSSYFDRLWRTGVSKHSAEGDQAGTQDAKQGSSGAEKERKEEQPNGEAEKQRRGAGWGKARVTWLDVRACSPS